MLKTNIDSKKNKNHYSNYWKLLCVSFFFCVRQLQTMVILFLSRMKEGMHSLENAVFPLPFLVNYQGWKLGADPLQRYLPQ